MTNWEYEVIVNGFNIFGVSSSPELALKEAGRIMSEHQFNEVGDAAVERITITKSNNDNEGRMKKMSEKNGIMTQDDVDALKADENGHIFFLPGTIFMEGIKFGDGCVFGDGCEFGNGCEFGYVCDFAEGCIFGCGCEFGPDCIFSYCCEFRRDCKFGERCKFGLECEFGRDCKFGHYCMFKRACYFGRDCMFGSRPSFGERCCFCAPMDYLEYVERTNRGTHVDSHNALEV